MHGLAFLFSFCSFGYQQAVALALYDASGDYVVSQSFTLALFLLGMGLGSLRGERGLATTGRLLRIEWILAALGAGSVHLVQMAEVALRLTGVNPASSLWWAVAPMILALGILTGLEWPLLTRLNPKLPLGRLLAANYMGAFLASALTPLFLFPRFDAPGTAHIFGLLNFLAATALLALFPSGRRAMIHLLSGLCLLAVLANASFINGLHLRSVYFSPNLWASRSFSEGLSLFDRLGDPVRLRSFYQWIDILPPEFSSDLQGRQDFQIYLDRKLQVSSSSIARYHQSFVGGGLNLLKATPNRVLILGGGDGLLAAELFKRVPNVRVDLVELDPAVLKLAREQRDLREMNSRVFEDSRLRVFENDAFHFLSVAENTYDLILIDLPFPANFDLALLYSKEFYARVKGRLTDHGIALLDFPLPGGRTNDLPTLTATLNAAGFTSPFAFGAEDFFVAVARSGRTLAFDYPALLPQLDDQTLANMISRQSDLDRARMIPAPVNSVLFPVRFASASHESGALSGPRPERRISYRENPQFLPHYLERWADAFSTRWPVFFQSYFLNSLREPRDLSEEMGFGKLWPRFQWGYESEGQSVRTFYQMFDAREPGRLRAEWHKSFCILDNSPWIGVLWTAHLETVEFYRVENSRLVLRKYKNKSFVGEYSWSETGKWTDIGTWPPDPRDPELARRQESLSRRFLIWPRSYWTSSDHSQERISYP